MANSEAQTICCQCGSIASGAFDERGWYCVDCAEKRPSTTAHPPRVGESPRAAAGMISANVRGVTDDGTRPDGAESWEWRPPRAKPDAHHDQQIVVGNTLQFQQSPPVHVNGSATKQAKAKSRGAARAEARADLQRIGDRLAELGLTKQEHEVWRLRRVCGYRKQEIATRLGMTETAVKKALERAQAKVRKEVPAW